MSVKMSDSLDEEDCIGLGSCKENFGEADEVISMIENLKTIYKDKKAVEKFQEVYLYTLDQYNEQPHLLDANLDQLLNQIIDTIKSDVDTALRHQMFWCMWVIVKVRGYKEAVKHFPHEVSDFEAVLKLLESQDHTDSSTWQTRYCLLVWMSIIVLIPFDMSRFDSGDGITSIQRVLDLCKVYLTVSDNCRDVAAFLTSRFLTRIDTKKTFLPKFIDWVITVHSSEFTSPFTRYGTLSALAKLLKYGKRDDLLPYATKLLKWILNTNYKDETDSLLSKSYVKIVQRIGLVYLKPIVSSWRYTRGNRSLAENLIQTDLKQAGFGEEEKMDLAEKDADEGVDVPDDIEDVINELLECLKSNEVDVRWSSAKGIGRVTGRLPKELADEVIGSVLELFSPREGDGAWHGGCLALAELARRGILLPSRLSEVVPLIPKALIYDEIRGYTPVGAPIRDAACYVCWAFARAYDRDVLKPYVSQLANSLLIVACYDREINCRRAASAAFQENVGRQGQFPHGIDILTVADFFEVGMRTNAYVKVSFFIAQFPEYTHALIDHLVMEKCVHWDQQIRELAAQTLGKLVVCDPQHVADVSLPILLERSVSKDLNWRHGCILAIGEIVHSLWSSGNATLIDQRRPEIENIVDVLRGRGYFRGMGGELMRQACASFIEKCVPANLGVKVVDEWLELLEECLTHKVPIIRDKASSAICCVLTHHFALTNPNLAVSIAKYANELLSSTETIRIGHAITLRQLPKSILNQFADQIVKGLIASAEITPTTAKWSLSRKEAIRALGKICDNLDGDILQTYTADLYNCFLCGADEYTLESRGDIGAWVREAAMTSLKVLTLRLNDSTNHHDHEDFVRRTMCAILVQCVGKIDKTRALAGQTFAALLFNEPPINKIPNREDFLKIFTPNICKNINWISESETFPLFVQTLALPVYSNSVMLGLILSVGGLTQGLVKKSSSSMFGYLKQLDSSELFRLSKVLVSVLDDHILRARDNFKQLVSNCIFPFLDRLFDSGCFECVMKDSSSSFALDMFNFVKKEALTSKETCKIVDSVKVFCHFLQLGIAHDVTKKTIARICIYLCHPVKYIRRQTSVIFYETLLVYGDDLSDDPEKLDCAMEMIRETDWEKSVGELKEIRNRISLEFGVAPPVSKLGG